MKKPIFLTPVLIALFLAAPFIRVNSEEVPPPTPTPSAPSVTYGSAPVMPYKSDIFTAGNSTSTSTSTQTPTCSKLINSYLGYGRINNSVEVIRLQAFLNRNMGTKLSTSGYFDNTTLSAVKLFQLKYSDMILKPWVDAGLSKNLIKNPSGYVYLTTQRQINMLECPSLNLPMPILR